MHWSRVDCLWTNLMFLSVVWTLILTAPIHCRRSIGEQVMLWCISLNVFWCRNKLIYILDGLRVSKLSEFVFFLWWTIPLRGSVMNVLRVVAMPKKTDKHTLKKRPNLANTETHYQPHSKALATTQSTYCIAVTSFTWASTFNFNVLAHAHL